MRSKIVDAIRIFNGKGMVPLKSTWSLLEIPS